MQKTTGATFRSILGSTIAASEAAGDTREKELC